MEFHPIDIVSKKRHKHVQNIYIWSKDLYVTKKCIKYHWNKLEIDDMQGNPKNIRIEEYFAWVSAICGTPRI